MIYLHNFIEQRIYPDEIADRIDQPDLVDLIQRFLYHQHHSDSDLEVTSGTTSQLPKLYAKIHVHTSTVSTFYAPSDISGIGGMRCERIRAVDTWRRGPGQYDCVFVNTDSSANGMRGLDIARV
jgi:hypothetical protein